MKIKKSTQEIRIHVRSLEAIRQKNDIENAALFGFKAELRLRELEESIMHKYDKAKAEKADITLSHLGISDGDRV